MKKIILQNIYNLNYEIKMGVEFSTPIICL